MQQAVDVLEVMKRDADAALLLRDTHGLAKIFVSESRGKSDSARAAVADLIDTGKRLKAADLKVSELKEFGGHEYLYAPEWREATAELSNAWCAFGNALGRVAGGAA